MATKVKEKGQKEERAVVSVTTYVPISVHRKMKQYQTKIGTERETDYTIMEAYGEFLKEYTKSLAI